MGLREFFEGLPTGQYTLESRTDDYLLSGRADTGIKIREGRLEIKTRSAILELRRIGAVEGMLEEWTKRSFMPAHGALSPANSGWVAVHKKRWATLYCSYENRTEYQVLSDTAQNGIQLEYTELKIGPDLWYTTGLEWPAEAGIPVADLPFAQVLESGNLDPSLSMGYPMFLKRLIDQVDL